MDMGLSAEQTAIRDAVHRFLRTEYPLAAAREAARSAAGHAEGIWRLMGEQGWLGLAIPAEYGGAGLGLEELAIVYEEFGRGLYQGPHFGSGLLCGQLLLRLGSEAQKRELLPRIATGALIMSPAVLEEAARWDEAGMGTQARRAPDGWRLTGTKLFVTHAPAAGELLCAARDTESGSVRLFRLRSAQALPRRAMPSTTGNLYHEVSLQDVPVSDADVIGEPQVTWPALREVLAWGAAVQCAEMLGLCRTILEMSVEYAKVRVQFGRPIGTYQAMQHVLADMSTRLDEASLLTFQAVSFLAAGMAARRELAMAKAYVNEAAFQIALDGMQVHGGVGYMMEHPLPHYAQRVLFGKMHLGDTDVYLEELAQALGL